VQVGQKQHFGVGGRAKAEAGRFKLLAEREEIVDLAVEGDGDHAGRIGHGLGAAG